ncbi:MAG: M20 family peptidase, partial [Rhizobiales bacterium]|nr:M20 family peptidase [Rhizobacter sp.]
AAASRLGAAVRLKTIASRDEPQASAAEFIALHTLLQSSFPKAHTVLQREVVGNYGLVYTWPGTDRQAPGIGLMAHQDVVPVAPGTEGDWQQPPFSGAVEGGFVWGRGAWDDKGNLMSMMEAVELLAASGFKPRQTIYLIFGHDEEVGGLRGAAQVARLFKERGIRLQFVLDEGLLITDGLLAGLTKPAALIGVAEKGYLSVQLTASAAPGHSSMPPPQAEASAIGMLSAALARLEDKQMPLAVRGLSAEMFETLAPEMNGLNRVFLSNMWLFRPVIEQQLKKVASTNATLRTTTALTVFNAGNADNVMPGRASATVNFRLLPGDTSDAVVAHAEQVVGNPAVKLEKLAGFSEASKVAATDAPGFQLINKTLRQLHPDVIVAPGLMIAATDSRHFDGVADSVYKFSPVRAKPDDLKRFHGTNERISIANHVELIQFYHQLIANSAPAP